MSKPIGELNRSKAFPDRYILIAVPALLSVYDKTGLLELAQGLVESGVRLLGSGGTAKKIREAGFEIECVYS